MNVHILHLVYIHINILVINIYVGHPDVRGTDRPVWRVASDALGHAVQKCLDNYSDVAAWTEIASEHLRV